MVAKHDKGTSSTDKKWPAAGTGRDDRDAVSVDSLLAQVARGDREAFASVYDHAAGTVYGLLCQMTGDPARSEDMTGEVLTEVWRTASLFSPSAGSGMSWIMAITRRHAVGQVRAARDAAGGGRRRPNFSRILKDLAEQAGVSPGGERAAGGLAPLPEAQHQALLLVYYGGYTQGQVADFLGDRPGTVSAWIRDGLPRLRIRTEW